MRSPTARDDEALSGEIGFLAVDAEGRFEESEGPALAALGVAPVVGDSVFPGLRASPRLLASIERALHGEQARVDLDEDGGHLWVRAEPRPGGGAVLIACEHAARAGMRDVDVLLAMVLRGVDGVAWIADADLQLRVVRGGLPTLHVEELVGGVSATDPLVARQRAALAGEPQVFLHEEHGRRLRIALEPLRGGSGVTGVAGVAIDVTDERRAVEDLVAEHGHLAEAQRVAHVGSWEWDISASRARWSDELSRIYGADLARIGGVLEVHDRFAEPSEHDELLARISRILLVPGPFGFDFRIVKADGEVRVLHTQGDVIVDGGARPERVVASTWDVTAHVDQLDKLRRESSLLAATLNASANGILVISTDGKITTFNPRFLAMWRIPPELAALGSDEKLLAFAADQVEDPGGFLRGVRELYDHPEWESFDVLRFKDGRVFERSSQPQRTGDEITGRVWSFLDVTQRMHLLDRATFFADAARLLATLDPEPAITAVARLAVPVLGDACAVDLQKGGGLLRHVEIVREGGPAGYALPPPQHSVHPAIFRLGARSALAVPIVVGGETVGAITFVSAQQRSYGNDDLAAADDLARRMSLTLENARLYRDAQDALRSREEFLAIAAHEIRGPVASMHLAIQTLQKGAVSDEMRARLISIIAHDEQRLARFVSELLDVGRIRSGQLSFVCEPVDLGDVVRDVTSRLAPELAAAGSRLTSAMAPRVVGEWDRMRLDQVVFNLLSNAIKFGRGRPIMVRVDRLDDQARLEIKDEGVGMGPEECGRLFRPFERLVPARQYGGLGLGLYIVRVIVEGMGGTVSCESAPGVGSTFTVLLPLQRGEP